MSKLEKPHNTIHKTRISLPSKNVKNLKKGCANLVYGLKDNRLMIKCEKLAKGKKTSSTIEL